VKYSDYQMVVHRDPEFSMLPYDPTKCSRRLWNDGFGSQCQRPPKPGREHLCGRCMSQHDSAEKKGGTDLQHGRYNGPRPLYHLDKMNSTKKHPWKNHTDEGARGWAALTIQSVYRGHLVREGPVGEWRRISKEYVGHRNRIRNTL